MSTSTSAVALPVLDIAGQRLTICCDLSRAQGPEELLAALTAWVELAGMPPAQVSSLVSQGIVGNNAWYALAMQRFRQALRRHTLPSRARAAVSGLDTSFFQQHNLPHLREVLHHHFKLESPDGQPTQAPGYR